MGYKLKRILIYPDGVTERQVYPAIRVQTFDFQNDGIGSWTYSSNIPSNSYYGYESGQGIYFRSIQTYANGLLTITPPNTIYNGSLSKVRLRMYRPSGYKSAGGIGNGSSSNFMYANGINSQTTIGFLDTAYGDSIGEITGEIVIEMDIESGTVSGNVNNTSFTVSSSLASDLLTARTNQTFKLTMVTRGMQTNAYIRKVEITTKI